MNKIALITTSLLILIIGIGCAAAADFDVNDSSLSSGLGGGNATPYYAPALSGSGLGGGGDNGPFYATDDLDQGNGGELNSTIPPQYLNSTIPPQYLSADLDRPSVIQESANDSDLGTVVVGESLGERRGPRGVQSTVDSSLGDRRTPRGVQPIVQLPASLGSAIGGGGGQPYY